MVIYTTPKWLIITLLLALVAPSCRTKYAQSVQSAEQVREDYNEGRISALDMLATELAHDSARLYTREYDSLGRLKRETWLERGRVAHRTEQSHRTDSLHRQATRASTTRSTTQTKGDTTPSLGIPWYAWLLAILGAVLLLALLILVRARR